jgi:hypothetical protein
MSIGHDMLALRRIVTHSCTVCGKEFQGLVFAKYCGNACKQKAKRARAKLNKT